MPLEKLPRHIVNQIVDCVPDDNYPVVRDILALRLVNRHFDAEICHAIYDRDILKLHYQVSTGQCSKKPTGVVVEKVVRGFILRRESSSQVLNTIRAALRDGALILMVLMATGSEKFSPDDTISIGLPTIPEETDNATTKTPNEHITAVVSAQPKATEEEEQDVFLSEEALLPICKAYVNILGDEPAFDSLDPTYDRDAAKFDFLEDKVGHFWALSAAVQSGNLEIVKRAAESCMERFKDEDDHFKLKTQFAAGLIVAANLGFAEIAKYLLAQPPGRVSLRFQSIRFSGVNAMEAAIKANQSEIINILQEQGWDFTTVPMDYVRGLKAVVCSKASPKPGVGLLNIFLEGPCQEWRSDTIVTGMFQELAEQGNVQDCKAILDLLQKPTESEHRWQWDFPDNASNNDVIAPPADDNDPDEEDWFGTVYEDDKTAIYRAIANDRSQMIDFIYENESKFPECMSKNFTITCRTACLEYAISSSKHATLAKLLPHRADVYPRRLFLYATLHGDVEAMKILLPLVDLNEVLNHASPFWDFSRNNSNLYSVIASLTDPVNPNQLLFPVYGDNTHCVKLGTYTLLCAIKALHVPAAKFLLEQGCEIGRRLRVISRNLINTRHARVFFPHELEDCENCIPHLPYLSKSMTLVSLQSFTWMDFKRMMDSGLLFPRKHARCFTRKPRRPWWWRWQPRDLVKMHAKIITGVCIPLEIVNSWNTEKRGDMTSVFKEMFILMRKWKMPLVYIYSAEDNPTAEDLESDTGSDSDSGSNSD